MRNSLITALLAMAVLLTTACAYQPGPQPPPTAPPPAAGRPPGPATTFATRKPTVTPTPTRTPSPTEKGKGKPANHVSLWPVGAALVALLAGLLVLLRPGRPAAAPAGVRDQDAPRPDTAADQDIGRAVTPFPYRQTVIPEGLRHTATVRSELHPQGYVEIDGCLRRAVWTDPAVPPPAPGGVADVIEGTGRDAGIWLALPSQNGTGPRGR